MNLIKMDEKEAMSSSSANQIKFFDDDAKCAFSVIPNFEIILIFIFYKKTMSWIFLIFQTIFKAGIKSNEFLFLSTLIKRKLRKVIDF